MFGLPPRPIAFRWIRSASSTWAIVRLMVALLSIPARPPLGSLTFVVVVLALTWLDARRSKEQILLANLGVRSLWLVGIVVVAVVGLEFLLWTILGTWMAIDALTPGPPPVGDV